MDNARLIKVNKLLQRDLAVIFREMTQNRGSKIMISVTKVDTTSDLSISKVYLSVFPSNDSDKVLSEVKSISSAIKNSLAQKIKNQIRRIPSLSFFVDDSLDYIQNIEDSLSENAENPIK